MAANRELAELRSLSKDNIMLIDGLHMLRVKIAFIAANPGPVERQSTLATLDNIEYLLQDLWRFKRDKKFHKFWELPGCECPKMDNDDAYPHGRYIYSLGCPIHKHIKLINDTSKESTDGDNNNGTNSTTEEVLP